MSQQLQIGDALIEPGAHDACVPQDYYDYFPGIVYIFDVAREEITYINKKIEEVLGYSVAEFLTLPHLWLSVVHPEDLEFYKENFAKLKEGKIGESFSFTARYNNKGTGCKYLKTTATLLDADKSSKILFFLQNVTDQVRNEEDALATRQLFDETEKLILFGSWSWNARSGEVNCTEGLCHILEYELNELHSKEPGYFLKYVVPEYLEQVESTVGNALSSRTDFEMEYVIKTRSGKEKFVYTKGKPILDKDGEVKKYLGITRDITNKKNAEKEKERRIRELNRSNKELEEFAYVASHDMHEPLRKILTFGEKIKTKYTASLGDDGKIYLDRIVSAAQNMRSLIDNLLEFSRVSRGTRAFVRVDINEVVKEAMSDQELRIEETGTVIELRDLPVVEAVPSELRQLFNNLLGNAIKFRKKEVSPVVTIACHKLTHKEKSEFLIPFNQTYYCISVQDNGIGFDSVYSEKIFEIFQRLNGKSEYSGSGIGLAICKKIVENHDGIIHATGEPGVGSVFSIILPESQYH